MADEESLGFEIDIDSKLDGAKSSAEVLDRLDKTLTKLDAHLGDHGKKVEEVGEGHEKAGKHAKTLRHELEELNKKLKELTAFQVFEFGFEHALELAHELYEVVTEVGKEAILAAAHEERIQKSFKFQLGDEEGEHVLSYLDELGKKTEFVDDETKKMGQSLIKAGFAAEDLPHAMAAIADLAAFSSDKVEGASAALEALTRIQRTGVVDNRSLKPFGIGEDALIKSLQERGQKGDVDSIKKLLSEKKIDREELLQAVYQTITSKTGKLLGAAGAELGQGLEARLHRLGNLPEQYFEKWANSPGFQVFSDRIEALFQKLDPDSPDGKRIFESLEAALNSVTGVVDKLLTPEGIDLFVSGLKSALDTVGALIRGLKEMIDLLTGETLSKYFYGGKNAEDKLSKQNQEIAAGYLNLANKGGQQGQVGEASLRALFYQMDEAQRSDLIAAGKAKGIDYAKFAPASTKSDKTFGKSADFTAGDLTLDVPGADDKAFDSGQKVAEAHLDGVRKGLDAHSPSRKMRDLGRFASIGFAEGIDSGAEMVQRAFSSSLLPSATTAPGLRSGGGLGVAGGVQIEINVPIEYHAGSGSDEDGAYALAERVREILPSALASALEQLGVELGAGAPEED